MFNENSLREEIIRVWGPAGAHVDVFDTMLKHLQSEPDPSLVRIDRKALEILISLSREHGKHYILREDDYDAIAAAQICLNMQ